MEWNNAVGYTIIALICLLAGYALGARRSRKVKKRVLRQYNDQSLELLEARASLTSLQEFSSKQVRTNNLLNLTLRKLSQARSRADNLQRQLVAQNKRHFAEVAKMRLRTVEAIDNARRAVAIARRATTHLKRLESLVPTAQTIEAPEPKSYGVGEPVTVSVVDQVHPQTVKESVTPVSNRDSARLTKLHSSNEATAPSAG